VALAAFIGLVVQTRTTAFGDPTIGTVGISLLCVFFGGVFVLTTGAPADSRAQRVAGSRVLRWFGTRSYCLYIVNQPAMLVLAKLGLTAAALQTVFHFRALALLGVNAVGIAVCSVIAYASWHLFEKRWLALKTRPLFNYSTIPQSRRPLAPRQPRRAA
jgi:peptidoglycan/LPS O-acetylase OafA/YrhL